MQVINDAWELSLHTHCPPCITLGNIKLLLVLRIINLNTEIITESLDCGVKAYAVTLHDKVNDVAMGSAGEAMECILLRKYRE